MITSDWIYRKRAKTAEEKEQRRVERVLRNRAAAQKSREVKKRQLEAIEQERDLYKEQAEKLQKDLQRALEEIQSLRNISNLPGFNLPAYHPPSPASESSISEESDYVGRRPSIDPTVLICSDDVKQEADDDAVPETALDMYLEPSSVTQQPVALLCDQLCPLKGGWSSHLSILSATLPFFRLNHSRKTSPTPKFPRTTLLRCRCMMICSLMRSRRSSLMTTLSFAMARLTAATSVAMRLNHGKGCEVIVDSNYQHAALGNVSEINLGWNCLLHGVHNGCGFLMASFGRRFLESFGFKWSRVGGFNRGYCLYEDITELVFNRGELCNITFCCPCDLFLRDFGRL